MAVQKYGTIENLFSLASMQAIVENIGSLIQNDIVIFNADGIIIAATSRDRIGICNTGVRDMIARHSEMLVVERRPGDGPIRPGINLPIKFEGVILGAVGITGEPEAVRVFGRIIQSFVQQQLVDLQNEKKHANQKRILDNFVYSWIFRDADADPAEFALHSQLLGIDTRIPRVVCVVSPAAAPEKTADAGISQRGEQIRQYLENSLKPADKTVVAALGSEIVVLAGAARSAEARAVMEALRQECCRRFGVSPAIGIGWPAFSPREIKLSYEAALLACNLSRESENREIAVFEMYSLELLVSTISSPYKRRIIDFVFRNCRAAGQAAETAGLLRCYIETNRSVTKTAQALHLHKNTVQWRLDRILEMTGYNPRDSRDLALLYAAVLIYDGGMRPSPDASS